MRTFVYVDGFNLYNRRLKHKPDFKWLDLKRFAELALGTPYSIARVNFYTARISGRIDPGAPARQSVYLNALRTIPEVAIHYGSFSTPIDGRPPPSRHRQSHKGMFGPACYQN